MHRAPMVSTSALAAQRVERLERENRRLKRAGLVALALAAVLVLTGQARSSRVMEANRFVLRDTSGRVRAELKTEEDLSPRLVLLDSHGASRAWLDLSKKGEPTLRFWRRANRGPVSFKVEGGVRYRAGDVRAYLAARMTASIS